MGKERLLFVPEIAFCDERRLDSSSLVLVRSFGHDVQTSFATGLPVTHLPGRTKTMNIVNGQEAIVGDDKRSRECVGGNQRCLWSDSYSRHQIEEANVDSEECCERSQQCCNFLRKRCVCLFPRHVIPGIVPPRIGYHIAG